MFGPMCSVCGGGCPKSACQRARFQWGFGGENRCFLMGRLDGVDLKPLDLCGWLYCHETDTSLKLVPNGSNSYIEYWSERDINGCEGQNTEPERIYICDMLNLASIHCLGDVTDKEDFPPKSCDILVYDPCCDDEACEACMGSDNVKKWTPYTIPDAGDCQMTPDANGGYKVLTKNDCGCIEECTLNPTQRVYHLEFRDSWPNSIDWPFHYGNYNEVIPFYLAQNVPQLFGKFDLEVSIEYTFMTERSDKPGCFEASVKSIALPFYDNETPNLAGDLTRFQHDAINIEVNNSDPWGTRVAQASRTFIVPKGKDLKLFHMVRMRPDFHESPWPEFPGPKPTAWDGKIVPASTGINEAEANFSRLHALKLAIRPVVGTKNIAAHRDIVTGNLTADTRDPFVPGFL